MALGGIADDAALNLTVSAVLTFTCLVDATRVVSPSTHLPPPPTGGQTRYFAMACPTCGTRYLIVLDSPAPLVRVQQTS